MTSKLKLNLDQLSVDSFSTEKGPKQSGTVFGEQCTCQTACTCPGCPTCDTCAASCNGTCGATCYGTCGASCDTCGGSCWESDCCPDTCYRTACGNYQCCI